MEHEFEETTSNFTTSNYNCAKQQKFDDVKTSPSTTPSSNNTATTPSSTNGLEEEPCQYDMFSLEYFVKTEKSFINFVKKNQWYNDIEGLVASLKYGQYHCEKENLLKNTYMFTKNRSKEGPGLEYCRLPTCEFAQMLNHELKFVPKSDIVKYLNCLLMFYIQAFSLTMIISSLRLGKRVVTDAVYQATLPFVQDMKMSTHEMLMCSNYGEGVNIPKGRLDFIIRRGILALCDKQGKEPTGFFKLLLCIDMHDDFKNIIRLYSIQFVKTLCSILREHDIQDMNVTQMKELLMSEYHVFKLKSFIQLDLDDSEIDYDTDYEDYY